MEVLIFILIILIIAVLICFCSLFLKKYANKYCNENNEEQLEASESHLYVCSISFCIILSIVAILSDTTSIIIKFGPLFITGLSIIFRIIKKQLVSNIFYGILVVPIILGIFIMGFFGFFQFSTEPDLIDIDELEIQEFNEKFLKYEGENLKGSTVKTLLQTVVNNNLSQECIEHQVEVVFSDSINLPSITQDSSQNIKSKLYGLYKVQCLISEKGDDKGLVYCILVTKKRR